MCFDRVVQLSSLRVSVIISCDSLVGALKLPRPQNVVVVVAMNESVISGDDLSGELQ